MMSSFLTHVPTDGTMYENALVYHIGPEDEEMKTAYPNLQMTGGRRHLPPQLGHRAAHSSPTASLRFTARTRWTTGTEPSPRCVRPAPPRAARPVPECPRRNPIRHAGGAYVGARGGGGRGAAGCATWLSAAGTRCTNSAAACGQPPGTPGPGARAWGRLAPLALQRP